jgi:hypothetical protein
MAKRVRGSSRPGQRRPVGRRPGPASARSPGIPSSPPATSPSPASVASRPGGLTDAEVQRAAEIEAALLAEERAAEATRRRTQERATAARETAGARAIRPEDEYAYVARDVRDIVRIAAVLLVILFGLWIAIDVVGVVKIT